MSVRRKHLHDYLLNEDQVVRRRNRIHKAARELCDALNVEDEEPLEALDSIREEFIRSFHIESDIDEVIAYQTCFDNFKADLLVLIESSNSSDSRFKDLRSRKRGQRSQI